MIPLFELCTVSYKKTASFCINISPIFKQFHSIWLNVCAIMQRKNTKRKSEKKKNNYATAVDAFCNYPCSCRLSCLHQPFAENLLDLWRKIEILNASMNRDHQLWQFHLPFFNHQVQQLIQIAIIRKSNILERKIMSKINIF